MRTVLLKMMWTLAKGTGFTLNTGRYEVEDVTIQTEPNETEDDEMVGGC